MDPVGQLRAHLGSALTGTGGAAAADRLCVACVDLLPVDGASLSLMHEGSSRGTYGSSSELSRRLDDYQFTFGEGPCMEAVASARPVIVADFDDKREARWPSFAGAVLDAGIHAVYALPVLLARSVVGALDLFSRRPGVLGDDDLEGARYAAELCGIPLLDFMVGTPASTDEDGWDRLAHLNRVEIHQATGMIISALDVDPVEALVRLRAHAMAESMTASQCAWAIVERRMMVSTAGLGDRPGGKSGGTA